MPLIVICGLPSSGKSYRSEQLREYFSKEKGKNVTVITENTAIPQAGYGKKEYFADSLKEKIVRSSLKSAVVRHLHADDDLVIFDAGNYIKGYRYEIYCATKAARVSQCTIFCAINDSLMKEFNSRRTDLDAVGVDNGLVPYDEETMEALKMRFEEPQGNNRWDAPLFTVFPESTLDFGAIHQSLYEKGPPPPNLSTQNVGITIRGTRSTDVNNLTVISASLECHQLFVRTGSDDRVPDPTDRAGPEGQTTSER